MSRRLAQNKPSASGSSGTQQFRAVPAYEPPILPLHRSALDTISYQVPKTHEKVEKEVINTLKLLTSVASDIGQRANTNADLLAALERAARSSVDASMKLQESKDILAQIGEVEVHRWSEKHQDRRARVRARKAAGDRDSDDDAEEAEGEDKAEPVAFDEGVWGRYKSAYAKKMDMYADKTDREKYGDVKEYADFRRTLWDAQNPDVPMPPVRQWFDDADAADDESDDELEVAQERISYKCPITQTAFVKPVTARGCKHSFEKDAILQMLKQQRGNMECPVPGCVKVLTVKDMDDDEYLLIKMKRYHERVERERRRAQEEESDEEEEGVEEEEEAEEEEEEERLVHLKKVKKEKTPTQRRRGRRPVELSDDEDEETETNSKD